MLKTIAMIVGLLLPGLCTADYGRVLYVKGSVTVERSGKLYRAVKNAKLIEGDTIETGAVGRMHIRMSDRSLVSLKPDTRFQIQTYRFDSGRAAPATSDTPDTRSQSDRSIFRLVKGGFRAITGLIGQRNRDAFGVSTSVATIGIRGTSFVADLSGGNPDDPNLAAMDGLAGLELAALEDAIMPHMGDGSLADTDGLMLAQTGAGASSGQTLTVGVADGSVILSNADGSLVLENGEFGQVMPGQAPSRLLVPPADSEGIQPMTGDPGDGGDDGGDGQVANRLVSGDNNLPTGGKSDQPPPKTDDEISTEDTEFLPRRNVALSSALNNRADALTLGEGAVRVNDAGQVVALVTSVPRNAQNVAAAVELATGAVDNAGFAPAVDLRWGRWSGGTVLLRFADGSEQSVSTAQANVHFLQSVVSNDVPVVPSTGSRQFVLIGNTNPSTDTGASGFLGNASLSADFDNQSVRSDLSLSVNDRLWEASGNGAIGDALSSGTPANVFAGNYDAVQVNRSQSGSGQFSGFFTEQAGAAGMSYRLNQGGESVSGVAAFEAVPR